MSLKQRKETGEILRECKIEEFIAALGNYMLKEKRKKRKWF